MHASGVGPWVAIHQCLRTYAFVARRTTDTILIVRAIHETHRTGNRTYEQNYDRFELFLVTCGALSMFTMVTECLGEGW